MQMHTSVQWSAKPCYNNERLYLVGLCELQWRTDSVKDVAFESFLNQSKILNNDNNARVPETRTKLQQVNWGDSL